MTNRRLPSAATAIGSYEPSPQDWEVLEQAYGHRLSAEIRGRMVVILGKFFERSGFELDGIKADAALKTLEQVTSAAEALLKRLEPDSRLPGFIEMVLSKNIPPPEAHTLVTRLRTDLRYFVLTMPASLPNIDGGFLPGEAWNDMVSAVLDLLSEYGLPSEIWITDGDGKPSPAVVLINSLQKQNKFPNSRRRHHGSLGALKKGMEAARRRGRKISDS